jgi:3-hydroxyisobutyrate dehydrogenase-like beta-hydroxyacid dehydrogenase
MSINTIAILSPGEMGHAVGRALGEHGYQVITCLQGRSDRTRRLAQSARIRDVPGIEEMVAEADLVLSILVPEEAVNVARRVAEALRATRAATPFADCNPVSPQTARLMDSIISSAGAPFIDASIVGGPPGKGAPPRFYVSGPHAHVMSALDGKGIAVRPVGDEVGRASAVKMCYAALTKGTSALWVALLTAAESLGITEELRQEFLYSQPNEYKRMESGIPGLPSKAFRWVAEMEEIAATFDSVGVTPYFHEGAAEIFRLLKETPFAQETPETIDRSRTLAQTVSVIAQSLPAKVD